MALGRVEGRLGLLDLASRDSLPRRRSGGKWRRAASQLKLGLMRQRVAAGELKAKLVRAPGISREILYQYLKV